RRRYVRRSRESVSSNVHGRAAGASVEISRALSGTTVLTSLHGPNGSAVNLSAYAIKPSRRNYVSKMTTIAASIMITASLLSSAASAHPKLLSAEPAAGEAAATSPKQIK